MTTLSHVVSGANDLIRATIQPREVTYYLVTKEQLGSIKAKSIATEVFGLIASLGLAAFVSVLITLKASSSLLPATIAVLNTYKTVFLCLGILFALITSVFYVSGWRTLRRITSFGAILHGDPYPTRRAPHQGAV